MQRVMGLFDVLGKHLESSSQEVVKQAGPAAAEAWKHAEKLGQEAGRHLAPVGVKAWDRVVEVSNVGIEESFPMLTGQPVSRSLSMLLPLHQMLFRM
jgi:hypothetical protein